MVVVGDRGMGVPTVGCCGPSTSVRGRGRALDTPNAVVIVCGRGMGVATVGR